MIGAAAGLCDEAEHRSALWDDAGRRDESEDTGARVQTSEGQQLLLVTGGGGDSRACGHPFAWAAGYPGRHWRWRQQADSALSRGWNRPSRRTRPGGQGSACYRWTSCLPSLWRATAARGPLGKTDSRSAAERPRVSRNKTAGRRYRRRARREVLSYRGREEEAAAEEARCRRTAMRNEGVGLRRCR